MSKVQIDKFAKEVNETLDEYQQITFDMLKEEVRNAVNLARNTARQKAPFKTKEYKKGLRTKVESPNSTSVQGLVYAGKKAPLNHLLENGHAKRGGGRTRAFPHIGPAQDAADDYLMDVLPKRLEEG